MAKGEVQIQVTKLESLLGYLCAYEKDDPERPRSCVVVIDLYASTWGPCNALKTLYRDISIQDLNDAVCNLKFLQVDADMILAELSERKTGDVPLSPKSAKRGGDQLREVMPEFWKGMFEGQVGKAQPTFLFYKDMKFHSKVEGVNTPVMRRTTIELIKKKEPASQFLKNPKMLEMWNDVLDPLCSEAEWIEFAKAINVWCIFPPDAPSLTEEEVDTLQKAMLGGDKAFEKGQKMTAKILQGWLHDDGDFGVKFREVLPGYEDRMAEERVKKEEAQKAAAAAGAAKAEEDAKKKAEEAAAAAAAPPPAAPAAGLVTAIMAGNKVPAAVTQGVEICFGKDTMAGTSGPVLGTAADLGVDGEFTFSCWLQLGEGFVDEGYAYEEEPLKILSCGEWEVSLRSQKLSSGSADVAAEAEFPDEWATVAAHVKGEEVTLYCNGEQVAKGAAKPRGAAEDVRLGGALASRLHGDIAQAQIITGPPPAGWFDAVKEGKEMLPDPDTIKAIKAEQQEEQKLKATEDAEAAVGGGLSLAEKLETEEDKADADTGLITKEQMDTFAKALMEAWEKKADVDVLGELVANIRTDKDSLDILRRKSALWLKDLDAVHGEAGSGLIGSPDIARILLLGMKLYSQEGTDTDRMMFKDAQGIGSFGEDREKWVAWKKEWEGKPEERNAGRSIYKVANEATRIASGDQRGGGRVFKSPEEALAGTAEWAKFLALMGCAGKAETSGDLVASLDKLQVHPKAAGRAMGQQKAVDAKAGCQEAAKAGQLFRGVCLGFPGGDAIYDAWKGLADGAVVGAASLTSTSLAQGAAEEFAGSGTPSILFKFQGKDGALPTGLPLWHSSDYPFEMEYLVGLLNQFTVVGAPAETETDGKKLLTVTLERESCSLPDDFIAKVRDDAKAAVARLAALDADAAKVQAEKDEKKAALRAAWQERMAVAREKAAAAAAAASGGGDRAPQARSLKAPVQEQALAAEPAPAEEKGSAKSDGSAAGDAVGLAAEPAAEAGSDAGGDAAVALSEEAPAATSDSAAPAATDAAPAQSLVAAQDAA